MNSHEIYTQGMEYLVDVVQKLSLARSLDEIVDIARHAARELTGADGAAFVLRDQECCYYVDEDAIGPLWKGKRFPLTSCISGWSMLNRQSVSIEDVFQDPRIPVDAYRPTFVKSLLMVPIRKDQPIGAIGNYWAKPYQASPEQTKLLEALASSTSIALENVQLYTNLKETNEFLEDSLQARDEFFSIASHELRTPISAIKLQLQMTDRKLQKTSEVSAPLKVSLQQVDKLAVLVEQLLDVSRIRLGKLILDYAPVDASIFVEETVTRSMEELGMQDHEVSLDIEPGLTAQWDPVKVKQILEQLLSNVKKHAPGSSVEISLRKEGEKLIVLGVKDHGPGIPHEVQERLFKRFERVHTPRQLGGLGLGLFIARSLVEAHQGTILMESAPAAGVLMKVALPVSP